MYIHLFQSGSGHPAARAIIGPHAGYKYCGACGGYAYSRIDPTNVKRVFILGPSHHVRLNGCAVSGCVKVIDLMSVPVVSKREQGKFLTLLSFRIGRVKEF